MILFFHKARHLQEPPKFLAKNIENLESYDFINEKVRIILHFFP